MIAVIVLLSLVACGTSDEKIKTARDLSFKGTELTVTLGTNKSTGYEWDYKVKGTCVEASINRSFKITGSQGDATGEVSIGFKGTGEGTATIVFTTPVGWDGTGAGDVYTVEVEVGPDGEIISAEGTEGTSGSATTETLAIADIAEGDVADTGETPYICWNGSKQFTHWETEKSEGSYHCTVTITLVGGVPTAEVAVDGSASHRTATVALKLVS